MAYARKSGYSASRSRYGSGGRTYSRGVAKPRVFLREAKNEKTGKTFFAGSVDLKNGTYMTVRLYPCESEKCAFFADIRKKKQTRGFSTLAV